MKIDFNILTVLKNHLESKMNFILFVSLSLLTLVLVSMIFH